MAFIGGQMECESKWAIEAARATSAHASKVIPMMLQLPVANVPPEQVWEDWS